MENSIILELKRHITNFNIRLLTEVEQVLLNNSDKRSMFIEFKYIDYENSKELYYVGILFKNLKFDKNIGVDINKLLDINKLEIRDISQYCWEDINWYITDNDDDGVITFAFYCKDVNIQYVKKI